MDSVCYIYLVFYVNVRKSPHPLWLSEVKVVTCASSAKVKVRDKTRCALGYFLKLIWTALRCGVTADSQTNAALLERLSVHFMCISWYVHCLAFQSPDVKCIIGLRTTATKCIMDVISPLWGSNSPQIQARSRCCSWMCSACCSQYLGKEKSVNVGWKKKHVILNFMRLVVCGVSPLRRILMKTTLHVWQQRGYSSTAHLQRDQPEKRWSLQRTTSLFYCQNQQIILYILPAQHCIFWKTEKLFE